MVSRRLTRKGDKPWDRPEYIRSEISALHRKYVLPQLSAAHYVIDGGLTKTAIATQAFNLIYDCELFPSSSKAATRGC